MRALVPLLLAVALVATAVPALGEGNSKEGRGNERAADRAPHRPAQMGSFNVSTQVLEGRFVAFSYTDTTLDAFRVGGAPLFDATVAGTLPGAREGGAKTEDAQVHVRTAAFDLLVHDNPEAVTRLLARGAITLTFVPGANVTLAEKGVATFTAGSISGRIRGESIDVSGRTLTSQGALLLMVDAKHGPFDTHRPEIGEAAARGHVGVEASFNKGNGDDVEQDIVSYGNVTMRTVRAERGNLTLQVEGHGTEGRVLVLNVDGAVLGADRADRLQVTLDNATIQHESNLSAFFDPDADGSVPVYHVVFDPESQAFQVLVRVPHYSVHTLSVTTLFEEARPAVVLGVVGGVVVLVAGAALLFRPRRAA